MNLPGFSAISSLSKPTQSYRARAFGIASAMSASTISPFMRPQAAMGRVGSLTLGVRYPDPRGDECQICDCTCYPFPC